jgi:competence protein ComEA
MQLSRRHVIAYLALAAVVAAVGVRYLVLDEPTKAGGDEILVLAPVSSPSVSAGTAGTGSSGAAPEVVVYVCGAVREPGVIRLPQGSRVADAVQLAGGASGKAEIAAVNLAARVIDGQQIVVPERARAGTSGLLSGAPLGGSAGTTAAATTGSLVNINTASLGELDALQGVGPSTAQKIIDYRTANGGFKTVDEIKNVPGIGDAKFAAMKDSITV